MLFRNESLAIFFLRSSSILTLFVLMHWRSQSKSASRISASTQKGVNRPVIPLQEKFHREILRGLKNISDTPQNNGIKNFSGARENGAFPASSASTHSCVSSSSACRQRFIMLFERGGVEDDLPIYLEPRGAMCLASALAL